ncbi:hypothetical protein B0H19DRAFT_1183611 [Mycena capillaripes]|nr:hypothetical protein B0H19DRAFT_1183611 [Mycena capillaripes]
MDVYVDAEEGNPPAYWPTSGDLRVENLSARNSPDGPKMLDNLSFHLRTGERIGVGACLAYRPVLDLTTATQNRTESGKVSRLLIDGKRSLHASSDLSLLRYIYTEATVHFDRTPTSKINLDDLRNDIILISQMPRHSNR